jgi:hypothetical protein
MPSWLCWDEFVAPNPAQWHLKDVRCPKYIMTFHILLKLELPKLQHDPKIERIMYHQTPNYPPSQLFS